MIIRLSLFLISVIFYSQIVAQSSICKLTSGKNSQCLGYKPISKNENISVISENNNGQFDIVVSKHNPNNSIIWSKKLDIENGSNDRVSDFIIDNEKNVVIIGNFDRYACIIKLKGTNGDTIFSKYINKPTNASIGNFRRIIEYKYDNSGDYILLGTVNYPDYHLIARMSNNGSLKWCKEYNIEGGNELLYCLTEASNGDIITGGAFSSGDPFDQGILKINANNGVILKSITYDLAYNASIKNSGFDDVCKIEGTDYIIFSTVINDGTPNPTRHGISIFNTATDSLERFLIYNFYNTSRSSCIKYLKKDNKILLGSGVIQNSDNNMMISVVDFNNLNNLTNYEIKNFNTNQDLTGQAYIDTGLNGEILFGGFFSKNTNTNIADAIIGILDINNLKCFKTYKQSTFNCSLPLAKSPNVSFISNHSFSSNSPNSENYSYTLTTLCQDDCIPTKKLFGISTPKIQDSICYNTTYKLPIAITHNTLATPILFKLYKKQNAAYLLVDSVLSLNNTVFNIAYTQAADEYRVIAAQKCSYNDTFFFKLIKYQLQSIAPSSQHYICQNESITLPNSINYNGTKAINYTWLDSALNIQISNAASITLMPTKNQTVYLQANAYCAQPISTKAWIYVAPIVADSSIVALHNGCSPHIDTLLHPYTIASSNEYSPFSWQWYIGANAFLNTPSVAGRVEDDIVHLFPNVGKYNVRVNMVLPNSKICKAYIDTVRVWQSAKAQFTINPNIVDMGDKEVQFINQSQNAIGFQWIVSDTSFYTSHSPLHILKRDGNFNVTLIAIGEKQCNDTIVKTLTINEQYNIMLPSAFSPNNDGINTLWVPYFSGITNLEMQIFNRWGELLYNCTGNCAWDGKYKGQLCEDGVYLYLLKVKSKKQQTYIYKGTLHLLH